MPDSWFDGLAEEVDRQIVSRMGKIYSNPKRSRAIADAIVEWSKRNAIDPGPGRDVSLDEYVDQLPPDHRARRELAELRNTDDREPPNVNLLDGQLEPEELKELEQMMAAQTKMTAHAMEAMGATATMRRSERLQVAGRVLAAMVPMHFESCMSNALASTVLSKANKEAAVVAVGFADALLARIDETEVDR